VQQATVSQDMVIAYEGFGEPSDPPVLLVAGLGSQMLTWHEDFCRMIADRGRYVVRYDNRDTGLSTGFGDRPIDVARLVATLTGGDLAGARAMLPYTLHDLADDGLGLLTALGMERAHVVGISMGGMIAQLMAIRAPERVLTLSSVMSTTGEREYGRSGPESHRVLTGPRPADRQGFIDSAEDQVVWRSKRYPGREAVRELAARSYDRAHRPAGVSRHLGAALLAESRADGLRALRVPTLVIHGLDDTLIDPSGGRRTAELVPGAELLLIPDMGHDLPPELWPELVDALVAHTGRDRVRPASAAR
jgi:pimeloyl-ACP methyl ester carboxylesterase